MPEEYRQKIGHVIYGCDICQQVCPYNRGMDHHLHPEMELEPASVTPVLQPMLTISESGIQGAVRSSGRLMARQKLVGQRNAVIALANYRDRTAIPELPRMIEQDPRPVSRRNGCLGYRGDCARA